MKIISGSLYQRQYFDNETDLVYNRFRYYDLSTGSYISQDPIGLAGGNPTLYGRYLIVMINQKR
ncbi:RHS repeat-associated core domain-containing protein [Treponema denticola]|uniref:RHS repeat-associated core domain-containing protein n=1 Tax=Treponema denticola TaxID=158 RepID=UPI003D8C2BC8